MSKSMKSSSLNYGLIAGISLTLIYVILYVIDASLLGSFSIGLLVLLGLIVLGFISTAKAKKINEGYLSFKEAFTAYFIPVAIGLLIPTLFLYVLFNFIDPETAEFLKEQGIEQAEAMMKRFGTPEADIQKALEDAAKEDQNSLGSTLTRYAFTLIFLSVIGLIAALTMKKKKED